MTIQSEGMTQLYMDTAKYEFTNCQGTNAGMSACFRGAYHNRRGYRLGMLTGKDD